LYGRTGHRGLPRENGGAKKKPRAAREKRGYKSPIEEKKRAFFKKNDTGKPRWKSHVAKKANEWGEEPSSQGSKKRGARKPSRSRVVKEFEETRTETKRSESAERVFHGGGGGAATQESLRRLKRKKKSCLQR